MATKDNPFTTRGGRVTRLTARMAEYMEGRSQKGPKEETPDGNNQDEIRPEDSISNATGRTRSSTKSSASLLKLKEEQRKAEIAARVNALREKHDMELRQLDYQRQQRLRVEQLRLEQQRLDDEMEQSNLEFKRITAEFKLKTDLAISEARTDVIEKFEQDDRTSTSRDRVMPCSSTPRYYNFQMIGPVDQDKSSPREDRLPSIIHYSGGQEEPFPRDDRLPSVVYGPHYGPAGSGGQEEPCLRDDRLPSTIHYSGGQGEPSPRDDSLPSTIHGDYSMYSESQEELSPRDERLPSTIPYGGGQEEPFHREDKLPSTIHVHYSGGQEESTSRNNRPPPTVHHGGDHNEEYSHRYDRLPSVTHRNEGQNAPLHRVDVSPSTYVDQRREVSSDHRLPATLRYSGCGSCPPNDLSKLAELLTNNQEFLPRMEPEVFDGNILSFPQWINSFESIIESRVSSPMQRLYYLGRYTAGAAKEAIQGLLTLHSSRAYDDAKRILEDRYGDKYRVYEAFKGKITDWPIIKPNDGEGLRRFSDFLCNCLTAMDTVHYLQVLNDAVENQRMLAKLPRYMVERWSRVVDSWLYRTEGVRHARRYPPFAEFCKFLQTESRIACGPVKLRKEEERKDGPRQTRPQKRTVGSFATQSDLENSDISKSAGATSSPSEERSAKVPSCAMCKGQHRIDSCPDFLKMNLKDRVATVKSKMLCLKCLRWGHMRRDCRSKQTCGTCGKAHPTTLHDENFQFRRNNTDKEKTDSLRLTSNRAETNKSSTSDRCFHSLIVPVQLFHKGRPHQKTVVYALLDPQSDACFIATSTMEKIEANGPEVQLRLRTLLGEDTITSQRVSSLVVTDMSGNTIVPLPECYTRDEIAGSVDQIPKPENLRRWSHLKCIADKIHPFMEDIEIGLLLGMNLARVLKPRDCIPGQGNDPYAVKTELGWGVIGLVSDANTKPDDAYCRAVITEERNCHFTFRTHVTEVSPSQVMRMFTLDFNEPSSEEKLSRNDMKFLDKLKDGIHQRSDGHYEMPLPFAEEEVILPNNRQMALQRLKKLKYRFQKNPQFKQDYMGFMNNLMEKSYAEEVPETKITEDVGRQWYLPHHGVYHPHKPNKIRVVFDCSAEYRGEVLNRHLLQGPDLINNLTGILCRFRQEPEAFACDIEGMFHQVAVNPEDRDYLRFLWWEDGQIDKEPKDYRMTVHIFGATSSPGCANFALKTTADQYEKVHGEEAAEFVRSDFYVDDGLKSTQNPESTLELIKSSRQLCAEGGFNLQKFICNNKTVLEAIPESQRSKNLQNIDLLSENLPIERTLGVQWCAQTDTFQFKVSLQDKPLTRRGVLSTVSSIFDPLGLLAPFILTGKRILQDLCRDGVDWDEPLSAEITRRWDRWKTDVTKLSDLCIPRCYKPENFGVLKNVEVHHFSDASLEGYGACSYIRLVDDQNRVHTSLVMAKSRVTPAKSVTVPRLELAAAVVSVKLGDFLRRELKYDNIKEMYWTDSNVVLGYIANESRRFHIYVANRVQLIREYSSPDQWNHIQTGINPADIASRGCTAGELVGNSLWWKGPKFLSSSEPLPSTKLSTELQIDDPEVRKVTVLTSTTSTVPFDLPERLKSFSSWHHAKRAVAVCLRFKQRLKDRLVKKPTSDDLKSRPKTSQKSCYLPVTVDELQRAEQVILSATQKSAFSEEVNALQNKELEDTPSRRRRKRITSINLKSSLVKLDPYIDEMGLLRVGGRIKKSHLPEEIQHPVILPRRCHVTRLIILHYHSRTGHSGRGITLNAIRTSGYWIISGRTAVAEHVRHCVTCLKLRGPLLGQKMGDLPPDRLVEPAGPFTYSAVDMFGPFIIRQGRSDVKRYGALFTCLSSRAVHIEITHSLTTDSFINAFRRFVCRRGPVRMLRSDRGTNFVGAKTDLHANQTEMDEERIRQELLKTNCDWVTFKMNVPHASHMGGVWERMIRSVRSVLAGLVKEHGHQLDDELLRTLMTEAEAIVNSRPLTYTDLNSPDAPEPLNPNQLLILKTNVIAPPPGEFMREDLYCRRRWRRVQYLANVFWSRWKCEYLQVLQQRSKWVRPRRNVSKGDIVLLSDANLPRNTWPMARVLEVYPGDDGLVRTATVAVGQSTYDRPIHKLVLLIPGDAADDLTDTGVAPDQEPDEEPFDAAR